MRRDALNGYSFAGDGVRIYMEYPARHFVYDPWQGLKFKLCFGRTDFDHSFKTERSRIILVDRLCMDVINTWTCKSFKKFQNAFFFKIFKIPSK